MPVSITRLKELIELARSDGVEAIDLVENGTHIRITRNSAVPLQAAKIQLFAQDSPIQKTVDRTHFNAPMFGLLHLTPAPGAKPFVSVGDHVKVGQQLCLIEAMKMFNACHSDREGRIDAILAEAASEVIIGQPLFRIVEM